MLFSGVDGHRAILHSLRMRPCLPFASTYLKCKPDSVTCFSQSIIISAASQVQVPHVSLAETEHRGTHAYQIWLIRRSAHKDIVDRLFRVWSFNLVSSTWRPSLQWWRRSRRESHSAPTRLSMLPSGRWFTLCESSVSHLTSSRKIVWYPRMYIWSSRWSPPRFTVTYCMWCSRDSQALSGNVRF